MKHADGSVETVKKAFVLRAGDELKTGKNGTLTLDLLGGSIFRMGENSTFELTREPQSYRQRFGSIVYQLLCLRKTGRACVKVSTTNACACVRGTKFLLETRTGWTRLRVYEHTVDFYNLKGKQKHVLVGAGFESVIVGSKPPSAPKRFG